MYEPSGDVRRCSLFCSSGEQEKEEDEEEEKDNWSQMRSHGHRRDQILVNGKPKARACYI